MKLYDDYQADVQHIMHEIKTASNAEERVKAVLKLARLRIDYYEERVNDVHNMAKIQAAYEEQYNQALWNYQDAIDEAYDNGVCLAGLTYA